MCGSGAVAKDLKNKQDLLCSRHLLRHGSGAVGSFPEVGSHSVGSVAVGVYLALVVMQSVVSKKLVVVQSVVVQSVVVVQSACT